MVLLLDVRRVALLTMFHSLHCGFNQFYSRHDPEKPRLRVLAFVCCTLIVPQNEFVSFNSDYFQFFLPRLDSAQIKAFNRNTDKLFDPRQILK